MASGSNVLSPLTSVSPSSSSTKSAKLLSYELQIDQARCSGSWAIIRDRLAGKHEKYSGKQVFRDLIMAEALLGLQLSSMLKEHPDYDVAPTMVPRRAAPATGDSKDFAKIRDLLLRVVEKSGGSGTTLMNMTRNLTTLTLKGPRVAENAPSIVLTTPTGNLGNLGNPINVNVNAAAPAPAPTPPPLDFTRQAHILLAKMDLLTKGDASGALSALSIADLPEDIPDSTNLAENGWTNAMKILVAQGWVLQGLAYHLQSDFVAAYQCWDRVVTWYCTKISPSATASDPQVGGAGRALRTMTNTSFNSLGASVLGEDRSQIQMVDVSAGSDQWVYWSEEASWRRTVQMVLKLGEGQMPVGFYKEEDAQAAVTLHLNMFPPPSIHGSSSSTSPGMLMRSRYALPLRERIRYLVTTMGGFSPLGTPLPNSPPSQPGKPSPIYGLTHGGRIKPNSITISKRVGTWQLEAATLLASYEECVTSISEFPKAIRNEREEKRYERVMECFEWLSMVNWESIAGEEEEEGDENVEGGGVIPEIEKWRKGWLTVEESYRSMYHSFNHLPFFRALIHSFGYLATNFPDSFTGLDRKEVLSMIETYLQLWVDGCKKELVEAEKRLADEEMLKASQQQQQQQQQPNITRETSSADVLQSPKSPGSRLSSELPTELSVKFAEEIWNSTLTGKMDENMDADLLRAANAIQVLQPPRSPSPAASVRTRESILMDPASALPGFRIPPNVGGNPDPEPSESEQRGGPKEDDDSKFYSSNVPLAWFISASGESVPCYLGIIWECLRMFATSTTGNGNINQEDEELHNWVLELARRALTHVIKAKPNAPSVKEYELCEAEARWILGVALCEWSASRCTVDAVEREKALEEALDELALAGKMLEGEPREWECLYAQAVARCSAGHVEVAIGLLRRCLQLQPTSIPVWHLLVLALSSSPAKAAEMGMGDPAGRKRVPSTIPEAWTLAETAWKELVVEGDTWSLVSTSRKVELLKLRCSAMWILRAYKGPTKALEECRQLFALFAKMFPSVMITDFRTVDTLLRTLPRHGNTAQGAAAALPPTAAAVFAQEPPALVTSPTAAVASLAGSALARPASPSWLEKDATRAAGEPESIALRVLPGASGPTGTASAASSPGGFARTISMSSVNTSGGGGSLSGSFAFQQGANLKQRLGAIPFVPDHMTNTYQFAPYDILLHLWLSASYLYRDLLMPEQSFAALEEAFKVVTDVQRREIRREDGPSTLNLLTGIVDVRGDPVRSKEDAAAGPLIKKRGWRYDMAPRRVRRIIVDVEVEWCLTEMLRRVQELEKSYSAPDPFRRYRTATDLVEQELQAPPKRPPPPVGFNIDSMHDPPAHDRFRTLFDQWDRSNGGNVNAALKLPFPDPLAPPPSDEVLADLVEHLHSLSLVADHHTPLRALLGRLYFYKRQAAESEYWLYRSTQDEKMASSAVSNETTALGGNWWNSESWLWYGRILAEIGQMKVAHPALVRASKMEKHRPAREWSVVGRLI